MPGQTTPTMNEIEKDQLSTVTVQCFTGAAGNLSSLPGLIKRVIEERVWERRDHHGRIIELSNLRELITKDPIHGWGEDPRKIEALLKDDPVVLPMWREAMKEKPGPKSGDNITVSKAEKAPPKPTPCPASKSNIPNFTRKFAMGS